MRAGEFCGKAPCLADLREDYENVILVDTVVTGATSGNIVRWNACEQRSTHIFRIADAVERLARQLAG